MKLVFKVSTKIDTGFFKSYLPQKMIEYFELNYNEDKTKRINKYLSDILHIKCSIEEIIMLALSKLYIAKDINNFILELDSNILVPNTSTKVIDVLNLIEYGNLELPKYNILTKIFNFVQRNIEILYKTYTTL